VSSDAPDVHDVNVAVAVQVVEENGLAVHHVRLSAPVSVDRAQSYRITSLGRRVMSGNSALARKNEDVE
jgi:hypothetical protein